MAVPNQAPAEGPPEGIHSLADIPRVHSRLEFVVRLPEFVLGFAAMQKKQQREPESREAEQTIDDAHPMGYAVNGQAEIGAG